VAGPARDGEEYAMSLAARQLVASALDLELAAVGAADDLDSLPAWDSLGHVKVILALEAALGRTLAVAELAQVRGVAEIARLLPPG